MLHTQAQSRHVPVSAMYMQLNVAGAHYHNVMDTHVCIHNAVYFCCAVPGMQQTGLASWQGQLSFSRSLSSRTYLSRLFKQIWTRSSNSFSETPCCRAVSAALNPASLAPSALANSCIPGLTVIGLRLVVSTPSLTGSKTRVGGEHTQPDGEQTKPDGERTKPDGEQTKPDGE